MAQVKIGVGSLWFILVLFLLGLAGLSAPAKADEVRPAYLELRAGESHDSHEYTVLWKQPVVENKRLPIDPVFPESCNLEETAPPELTGNALIKRWRAYCDLSTATIEISGLRT